MKFPKLKNAMLCRVTLYASVLGIPVIALLVMAFTAQYSVVPIVAVILIMIVTLCFLVKNFILLFSVDAILTGLHCYNTARRHFVLPCSYRPERVERRVARFGKRCEPAMRTPLPDSVRYSSRVSHMTYARAIERVVLSYHADMLDKDLYHAIVNSARASSELLKDKKRYPLFDKMNKGASLNRVTVVIITADRLNAEFKKHLHPAVCSNGGDGLNTAFLPCVVDLEDRTATFDSMREPYLGFQYPVKNRGIKMIRQLLFGGKLTYSLSHEMLEPTELIKDVDAEESLYSFWKNAKKLITDDEDIHKKFENMTDREFILEDDFIYLKWGDRGIWVAVDFDKEKTVAEIDPIDYWYYPKSNKIARNTADEMKQMIGERLAKLGYIARFTSIER